MFDTSVRCRCPYVASIKPHQHSREARVSSLSNRDHVAKGSLELERCSLCPGDIAKVKTIQRQRLDCIGVIRIVRLMSQFNGSPCKTLV